jgi:hypothetical protein
MKLTQTRRNSELFSCCTDVNNVPHILGDHFCDYAVSNFSPFFFLSFGFCNIKKSMVSNGRFFFLICYSKKILPVRKQRR